MKRLTIVLAILASLALTSNVYSATQFDFLLSQVRTSTTALIGGTLSFYSPGTTTAKTIWLDRGQITPAANPYTLDANGTAQLYGTGSYRIVIKDFGGVTRFDRDNITMAGDDSVISAIDATLGNQTFLLPASGAVVVCKTDSTANTVTITPSIGGQTSTLGPLSVAGECAHLGLSGTIWYVE